MHIQTTHQILKAYSEGEICAGEARDLLGCDFRTLLIATFDSGFRLPKGQGREAETMREVAAGVDLVRELVDRSP